MSNTSSSPTTAIRGSSSGANAAATAVAAAAGGGVNLTMRGPCPPTTATATATTITTSYHEQQCPPTATVMYPVASSGRGFLPTNHSCRPILPYHPHPQSNPFGNPRPPPPPPPLPHPSHSHPPLKGLPPSLHPKVRYFSFFRRLPFWVFKFQSPLDVLLIPNSTFFYLGCFIAIFTC